MADEETITVAEVSEGDDAGQGVELPVVEVLTGRAFLTGKSGSGKSNTASVVAEKLLDRGFGLLVVDIEGEYYGLKEEYEILHAGADEECDIQVSEEHAGKLASLALEQNVPIILDLSGFLDEEDGRDLLTAVAKQLFAKAKKRKQPFLLVVEEIHEFVPEGGSLDECGKMLVKVAKRGRKHGLGVAGISQRPADVKKDYITQCDWLVWHRLTWQNDTRVVKRVLGADYAEAVEELDDGEGFMMTDWDGQLRRVQFQRKRTFDAGATPGLEDVERPDLKSVSDDLVADLQDISEEQARREDRINDLEAQLAEREQYVEELEAELEEARDLSRMAEQFVDAMTRRAPATPSTQTELPEYAREEPLDGVDIDGEATDDAGTGRERDRPDLPPEYAAVVEDAAAANEPGAGRPTPTDGGQPRDGDEETAADAGAGTVTDDDTGAMVGPAPTPADPADTAPADGPAPEEALADGESTDAPREVTVDVDEATVDVDEATLSAAVDAAEAALGGSGADGTPLNGGDGGPVGADAADTGDTGPVGGIDANGAERADAAGADETATAEPGETGPTDAGDEEGSAEVPLELDLPDPTVDDDDTGDGAGGPDDGESTADERGGLTEVALDDDAPPEAVAADLRADVEALGEVPRAMLARYSEVGVSDPESVFTAVTGEEARATAYRHNRALRKAGFVVHSGRGRYAYALPSVLEALCAGLDDEHRELLLETVEEPLR
jgi:uncharacterized coiled-coil protein SlyX